ncbi:MAG: Sec-independent protein translocase protein TatB [Dehalococcoidia bacterium]|nr:Sec-independent protein translocase protein TatB [Dehalococcoidia bacterium]
MDFLGIGLPELIVILVLTLIVVGPRRLPETAAQVARTIRQIRQYSTGVTRELNDAVKELEREYEELKGELKEAREEIRRETQSVGGELTAATEEAERTLRQSVADARGEKDGAPLNTSASELKSEEP